MNSKVCVVFNATKEVLKRYSHKRKKEWKNNGIFEVYYKLYTGARFLRKTLYGLIGIFTLHL